MESSTEPDEEELSSIEVSKVFSKIEFSSLATILSSGVGKFSLSGGKIRGSYFCIKNSSVDFCFSPVIPRLTESRELQEMTKKINDIIYNIFLCIFRNFFLL